MTAELLRYQIEYAAWANDRVLTAAQDMSAEELLRDFGSSERTILATLTHIYRAERTWLGRLEGNPVAFFVDGDDTMAALRANWPALLERWRQWSGEMTDESAQRDCTYHDLKGNPWTQPAWKIVLHVVNHSTHHRGQVMGFTRAAGHVPPNTDSIAFARLLSA